MKRLIIASLIAWLPFIALSGPAFAIPIAGDYTLASTVLNGTFTVGDLGAGLQLTAWSFTTTPVTVNFTGLPASPDGVIINNEFSFSQLTPGTIVPRAAIQWEGAAQTGFLVAIIIDGTGAKIDRATAMPSTVPEPSTILLFASGLLGLAGYRWSQRRREGTQLG